MQFFIQQGFLSIFSFSEHIKAVMQEGIVIISSEYSFHVTLGKIKTKRTSFLANNVIKAFAELAKHQIILTVTIGEQQSA